MLRVSPREEVKMRRTMIVMIVAAVAFAVGIPQAMSLPLPAEDAPARVTWQARLSVRVELAEHMADEMPSYPAARESRDDSSGEAYTTAHEAVRAGDRYSLRSLVERFFRPGDVEWALAIVRCESTNNPRARNRGSGASGWFQHLPKYWAERSAKAGYGGADIFDPVANVAVAAWLFYEGGGAGHWSCKARR